MHSISPINSSGLGPGGHVTAHLRCCSGQIDRITSPTLSMLGKSLAEIVFMQFSSIEVGARQTDRVDLRNSRATDSTGRQIDSPLLLSSMLRSYSAYCVKTRRDADCAVRTQELRTRCPESSQSTQLEYHHQQMWSPGNPLLLLHLPHEGGGGGTSPLCSGPSFDCNR